LDGTNNPTISIPTIFLIQPDSLLTSICADKNPGTGASINH